MTPAVLEQIFQSAAQYRLRLATLPALMVIVLVLAVPMADEAHATRILDFSGVVANQDGTTATQAAFHPYSMLTSFQLSSLGVVDGQAKTDGQPKEIVVDLPPGFVGNPAITPTKCTTDILVNAATFSYDCPNSSQVGFVQLYVTGFAPDTKVPAGFSPLYNMRPRPGAPAEFAFLVLTIPVYLVPRVRTESDYGLTVEAKEVSQVNAVVGADVTLWGVPAESSHDSQRICPGVPIFFPPTVVMGCSTDAARLPFITSPGNCEGPLRTGLKITTWTSPNPLTASFITDRNGNSTAMTGCDRVPFHPEVSASPTTSQPDSPTGLDIRIEMPTEGLENPSGLAQAHVRQVQVTLPEGMTVSPAAADGLKACSPTEIALSSSEPPTCPDASKLGSVEIRTPLLPDPMRGSIYLAKQGDNPFGSLLAMYLVASGQGIVLKLPGEVSLNGQTGQITARFVNAPQLPFESLSVKLNDGERAPLATPVTCGTKVISVRLTSWAGGPPVERQIPMSVDCPGASGLSPVFTAGLVDPRAASFSPFALRVHRPDRQEFMDSISAALPKGLLAKVRGVPLCSSVDAAAGLCPTGSRIGVVTVGAGPGPRPFFLKGSIYLTEGYRGGPYGLAIAVRAAAGPLDLGMVVVRQGVFVDPEDATISAVSDGLPTILDGIPLRLRTVQVDIDRSDFMRAPTSCVGSAIKGAVRSVSGAISSVRSRFQTTDCRGLAFGPKLALRLKGRKQVRQGKHPRLSAVLTHREGAAGIRSVSVRLPLSLALDPDNARALCEYEDGLRNTCPRTSRIGRASAVSPLLNRPLVGPVYFVKGIRFTKAGRRLRTLPTLLIPLRGEIGIDVRAKSAVRGRRLVTTFAGLPDAPISRFSLSLAGGRRGILVVTNRSLCRARLRSGRSRMGDHRRRLRAAVAMVGQNGRRAERSVSIKTPCRERARRPRRGHRSAHDRALASSQASDAGRVGRQDDGNRERPGAKSPVPAW